MTSSLKDFLRCVFLLKTNFLRYAFGTAWMVVGVPASPSSSRYGHKKFCKSLSVHISMILQNKIR